MTRRTPDHDPRIDQLRAIEEQITNLLRGKYAVPDGVIELLATMAELRTRIECGDGTDPKGFRERISGSLAALDQTGNPADRLAADAIRRRMPSLWE